MSRKLVIACVVSLGLIGLITSCEWKMPGDGEYWSDKYSWVNFSGVYRSTYGGTLVKAHSTAAAAAIAQGSTNQQAIAGTSSEVIGTGDGSRRTFAVTTLGHIPLVPGSVFVTDGNEAFTDVATPGTLTSDKQPPQPAGSGSVNYNTGALQVTFGTEVGSGDDVTVSYQYYVTIEGEATGTTGTASPVGSSLAVYSLTVYQQGNLVTISDNNAAQYSGKMGDLSSTGGFETETALDGSLVVAQFTASGTSANGRSVKIVGTLQGVFAKTTTGDTTTEGGTGATSWQLTDRQMQGTWIEDDGRITGDISGYSENAAVTLTGVSNGGTNTTTTL